jgi:hypothetical protein
MFNVCLLILAENWESGVVLVQLGLHSQQMFFSSSPIQWIPGFLSPWIKRQGVKITIHSHLPTKAQTQSTWSLPFNVRSTVNNFVDWPHIGAVMHYSGYVEPRDGAVSVLLSSQQEAVACVRCIQKESHVLKGSCLRAAEIENVAVWATGKRQVLPKIRQIR